MARTVAGTTIPGGGVGARGTASASASGQRGSQQERRGEVVTGHEAGGTERPTEAYFFFGAGFAGAGAAFAGAGVAFAGADAAGAAGAGAVGASAEGAFGTRPPAHEK